MSYQTPPAYSPMSFSSSSSPSSSDTSAGASAPRTKRARVSAEHTLNRVRENQRRHRARQRDHVASLELKLAETERLLVEARAEIALLRQQAAERDGYDGGNMESGILDKDIISIIPPTSTQNQAALFLIPPQNENTNNSNTTSQEVYPDMSQSPNLSFFTDTTTPTTINTDETYFLSLLPLPTDISLALPSIPPSLDLPDAANLSLQDTTNSPPPCCSDPPAVSPPPSESDPECTTCKTRPPPSPTESTTLCAQAYILIRQQNFRNLDPHTIRLWLAQGLRRAQREGEGCRVENGALLRLLDFISGV